MGDTFYVTKHGSASDLNGGTNATTDAWATAIKGFSSISGGDTLVFGTGTYDIARPSIPTPIPSGNNVNEPTIITDNGDGVVTFQHPGTANRLGLINFATGGGKSYISFIGTAAGQIVFDGEDQTACATLLYFSQGIPSLNSHLTVTNCVLKDSTHSAVLGGHTPNLTFDNCDIFDNGSHSEGTPENPQDHGIYASGANLVIKNCRIYDNWGYGLQTYSSSGSNYSGRELYNNWIYNNGYGSGSATASGIIFSEGSGTIYNNLIFENAGHGIELWRTASVTIYHNSIDKNGLYDLVIGDGGGSSCSGTVVKNNLLLDGSSGDVLIRSNAVNTVLAWNRISDSSISNSGSNTTSTNLGISAVDTDIWEDPINTTLGSRDYSLKAGSDAISPSGIVGVGVTIDIEGTTRTVVDQGAYANASTPPDPPLITNDASYIVSPIYGAVTVTLTKQTDNIVKATITGTGAAALCVDHTDVTVVRGVS